MGIALRDFTFDPKQKSEIEKKNDGFFFPQLSSFIIVCFFFQILQKNLFEIFVLKKNNSNFFSIRQY